MIFIDLIGAGALFIISSLYIGRVIRPLEEGQRKQNAFVAAASHELRSPLTVIKTGAASIREDVSKADQFLPHVERECERMSRLINDMLLLAAADAKTWDLNKGPVDMETLLIECYDMICNCLNQNGANIALDLPQKALYIVEGDRERMKQILTILVDNAISHTGKGDNIIIRAYNQRHSVVLEVEDHGDGIPNEEKKRVFERFYRGDQSRSEKKHFGLGLSIAKELVELHQGDITIRDTQGGGATFIVRLPV
jgi:signal transduction histidine kinase